MGFVRLLLAASVLAAHSGVEALVGGPLAVQIFFMISGYLISYVLTEAKTYSGITDFYINRALRIFPLYWVVALIALAAQFTRSIFLGKSPLIDTFLNMPPLAWYFVGVSNFTILGQDHVMFMSVQDSILKYSGNFATSDVQLWQGLLIPQAWSLGIELAFYLVAPFILMSRERLLFYFVLSLALRAFLVSTGLGMSDPWSYRFFPTELAVFLAGAISHQFISPRVSELAKNLDNRFSSLMVLASVALVGAFPAIPLSESPKVFLVFGFFLFALPFLFQYQKQNAIDNFCAQLSYPVYVWHYLVIDFTSTLDVDLEAGAIELAFPALVATLALSWLSVILLENPIEKLRNRFRTQGN